MHVWIVEMMCGSKWHPTVGCGLSRVDGLVELVTWRSKNPSNKFRLKKYTTV